MVEAAKERLDTFRANNKSFWEGRKLSDETRRKISLVQKERWSKVPKQDRREKMRKCWEASPMNKKNRSPTMRIVERDEIGRIVKAVAIS